MIMKMMIREFLMMILSFKISMDKLLHPNSLLSGITKNLCYYQKANNYFRKKLHLRCLVGF